MLYLSNQTPFKEWFGRSQVIVASICPIVMSSLALLVLFIPSFVGAQQSCGDIITTSDGVDERTPIENCGDPFGIGESQINFPYQIEGISLNEGEVREVSAVPLQVTSQEMFPGWLVYGSAMLYRHEGSDYRLVDSYYQGEGQSQAVLHVNATGTYSIVTNLGYFIMSSAPDSWLKRIRHLLIPNALAQSPEDPTQGVLTFTIAVPEPEPEPTGASSVLFLPGILGSRLFEEGDFCDGAYSEKEIWFSTDECKQLRLTTRFTGQSVNPVYTKGSEEGLLEDAFFFFNIYETFLEKLADLEDEDAIEDYTVFPYDWRLELNAILKSGYDADSGKVISNKEETIQDGLLYKLISTLARGSKSGKVTVVAHSNGGLVIKQFISSLQYIDDPLLEKIDVVVLVSVPQLGSPGSIIGMLHGEEVDNVMSQEVTRQLMNTMPFAHHLLPTSGYFDLVDTPVITIESGTTTDAWVDKFGNEISSRDGLHAFLSEDSGREKPESSDLATPQVVENFLLDYAETVEIVQDDFEPPATMKVYQVAGIGVLTPSQLTYFTDRECVRRSFFVCTEYQPKLGYRIETVIDGDETVLTPSALAMNESSQIQRKWINLLRYNDDKIDRSHKDILEIEEVSDLVEDLLKQVDGSYEYLSESEPVIDGGDRLVFQLHSPLDLMYKSTSGQEVSSSTNEIEGSFYRRYGELQYLSIPANQNGEIVMKGLATGSFTLDVEKFEDNEMVTRQTFSGVPSATSTVASLELTADTGIGEMLLRIDYDGDTEVDVQYDEKGIVLGQVTYDDLYKAINESSMKKAPKTGMLTLAKTAERLGERAVANPKLRKLEQQALELLIKQSILYVKLGLMSGIDQAKVQSISTQLINK